MYMVFKISIIIGCCLLFNLKGYSQNNSIVTWQSESIKNMRNNEENSYVCKFNIYPSERIEWVQGDKVFTFQITSIDGDLPNEGLGSVTYKLRKEGKPGKVIVERVNGEDTMLTLDLSDGQDLGAYFRFKVFNP